MDKLFENWLDQHKEAPLTISLLKEAFVSGYVEGQNVAAQALLSFRKISG